MANLKLKKISDKESHYVDSETNEPVFVEHKVSDGRKAYRYNTEIHPDFKEIHSLNTPYTHIAHNASDRTPKTELEDHYNSVLNEKHSNLMNSGLKIEDKGLVNKTYPALRKKDNQGNFYDVTPEKVVNRRELHVRDNQGDLIGKVSIHPTESFNYQTREYTSEAPTSIHPNSTSTVSLDEKYLKKNKFHPELVEMLKHKSNNLEGHLESFRKMASYKDKKPSFFGGGINDENAKTYRTTLKPKEAIDRFIKHVNTRGDIDFKVSGDRAFGKEGNHTVHTVHYTPSKDNQTAATITHTAKYIGYTKKPHDTIIEGKTFTQLRKELNEVAEMPEIKKSADVGNTIKHAYFLLNKGEDMNGDEHESMQIGPVTKSGHVITYHYPVQKPGEWESKRYLTAHHQDDITKPHVALSMDVETRGVPSFKVGGLSKDKIHSTIPAHEMYAHFIKHGPEGTIMSSDSQSLGGEETWKKLAKHPSINVHGYDPESDKVVNTHPLLHPDFRHETHGDSLDPRTRPGRENNKGYRLWLVAHKKIKST